MVVLVFFMLTFVLYSHIVLIYGWIGACLIVF